jgi:AraC-like DNA-binding protein
MKIIQTQKISPKLPILQKLLDCFWLIESNENMIVQTIPNGRVDAWFNLLGEFTSLNSSEEKRISVPNCGFFGLSNRSQFFETQESFKTINLKFFPNILVLPIFRPLVQSKSLMDWQALFDPKAINELKLKIASSVSLEAQIQALEEFFAKNIFAEASEIDTWMDLLIEMETLLELPYNIQKTAHKAHISVKTLERKFKKYLGLNPKEFYKLLRFQKTSQQIQNQLEDSNFSERLGLVYYDQSHFIKECKSITGLSPKSFFKKLPPSMTDLVIR